MAKPGIPIRRIQRIEDRDIIRGGRGGHGRVKELARIFHTLRRAAPRVSF
jgi:hypothetical protein